MHMIRTLFNTLFILVCLGMTAVSQASTTPVPPTLEPWREWVLHKHPDYSCPYLYQQPQQKRCAWPSLLQVKEVGNGVEFEQSWDVYAQSWLILPGDQRHWPKEVKVNQQPAAVLERNGRPVVQVDAGRYKVAGKISWKKKPQYLALPEDVGIVIFSIAGKLVENPNIDRARLWFSKTQLQPKVSKQAEAVKVDVFRKLIDDIPLQLETKVRFAVSGRDRELVLGRLLPLQSEPVRLDSPLPARVEEDGRLRIQVRAGQWEISLLSRYLAPVEKFSVEAMDELWPTQEVWVFQANRQLRSVKLDGAASVDPSQLNLPQGWSGLSTYLMSADSELALTETYRGNATPAENELQVNRELWLDFDGSGYTAKDYLSGKMNQGWRLNMQPGYELGRAAVGGEPRLITRLEEGEPGLEIREGHLDLVAVSRYLRGATEMGAIGWSHDVAQLSAQLHLPPGWMLLHASGVDLVQNSWLSKWDLWDLFLCLIIAVSIGQLLGLRWGLIAAAVLAITYHEQNAPLFIWLNIVGALALLRVLPAGRLQQLLRNYHFLSLLLLVLMVLVFAVEQIREGLYPQLERDVAINTARYSYSSVPQAAVEMDMVMPEKMRSRKSATLNAVVAPHQAEEKVFEQFDRNARIQTGPGEPTWYWHNVSLHWSGPVAQGQDVQFYYLSPMLTRLLKFLQVILIAVLTIGLMQFTLRLGVQLPSLSTAKTSSWLLPLVFLFNLLPSNVPLAQADYPPETLLIELERRLLEPPLCTPDCVNINQVKIQLAQDRLILRLQVDSLAHSALPLPAQRQQWLPRLVVLDGKQVPSLFQDSAGQLFTALEQGRHELILEGPVYADTLLLPFKAPAHNVDVEATGWQVRGLIDGAIQGGSLQLDRIVKTPKDNQAEDQLLPRPIDPFVLVERTLHLGVDWEVRTKVTRIAPSRSSINLQIPLWPNEAVVSGGIKTVGGKAIIAMAPNQREVSWQSSLQQTSPIKVKASENQSWVEHWRIAASPIWHVNTTGLVGIQQSMDSGNQMPEWRPWPGEELSIEISRPLALEGPVQTVESAKLSYVPGKRASISTLEIAVRASLGGEYPMSLPTNAQIQELVVDGQTMVVTQDPEKLTIPMRPGLQSLQIKWKTEEELSIVEATPNVILSTPAANVELSINLPRNRWPLLVGGPSIGPAMLFWGVLIVILLLAVGLSWMTKRQQLNIPVKTYQWVLLGLGMSTVTAVGGVFVVLWFFAMERRARLQTELASRSFDLMQLGLILLSIVALMSLISTIPLSLLSLPNMQVTGNGSSNFYYQWYQDRTVQDLPTAWVISVPIWFYRIVMLAWSLWVVFALLGWLKWGWQCFSANGLWKRKTKVATEPGDITHNSKG